VGRNEEKKGVCGRFGVGQRNDAGRDLIEWCEDNAMAYVNSFIKHRRRGTWFNLRYGRWYELDGFIVRQSERHRMVKKMRTTNEWGLSDHRPKIMSITTSHKRWRVEGGKRERIPNIKWEKLKDPTIRIEYQNRTRELYNRAEESEQEVNWTKMSEIMITAAKEVCGIEKKRILNPWMMGHEEEMTAKTERVTTAVERRNDLTKRLEARRRLRTRRDDRALTALEQETNEAKEELKMARKEVKKFGRKLEKEWWEEKIKECREACETGKVGDMYKCLKRIGTRGKKEGKGTTITVNEFREHFEKVSKDRYEVSPNIINEVIQEIPDAGHTEKARQANGIMNETPSKEEIEKAMREIKE